jgi:hypothetical protein
MRVNQKGEEIFEEYLYDGSELSVDELQEIVFAILDVLNLRVKRTNATRHGDVQIVFESTQEVTE